MFAGVVAADLIMAHRLRGAVHTPVPEDDQFELERLMAQLMRATTMTHAHVARQAAGPQPADTGAEAAVAPMD